MSTSDLIVCFGGLLGVALEVLEHIILCHFLHDPSSIDHLRLPLDCCHPLYNRLHFDHHFCWGDAFVKEG
jgi:hypothetical protein